MFEVFTLITIAAALLLITNALFYGCYVYPRTTLLVVAGYLLLGVWLVTGPVVYLTPLAVSTAVLLLGVWFVSAALGLRPHISYHHVLKLGFALFVGFMLAAGVRLQDLFGVFVAAATASAAVAVLHNRFHIVIFSKIRYRKKFEPSGLIGNPNSHASFLLPNLFLAFYLGCSHWAWFLPVPLLGWALWLTRCRAAMIGAYVGAACFAFLALPVSYAALLFVLQVIALPFAWRYKNALNQNNQTFRERINFWRVGWEQIKATPVLGVGFDCFKVRVPYLQRDINERTNGEFLKEENYKDPWPQNAHSNVVQGVLDNGLVGFGILAAITIVAFIGTMQAGSVSGSLLTCSVTGSLLTSALAAIIVNGLFFNSFHILPTNLTFWAIAGSGLRGESAVLELGSWPVMAAAGIGYLVLGVMIYRYVIKKLIWAYGAEQYMKSKHTDEKELMRVLKADPRSTFSNISAATFCWRRYEIARAYTHVIKAIEHYDGEMFLWLLYTNLGNSYYQSGAINLALGAFEESLRFFPRWEPGRAGAAQARQRLEQINAALRANEETLKTAAGQPAAAKGADNG